MSEILAGITIVKGAIDATKGAADIVRTLSDAKTDEQRREAVLALRDKIYDVQTKLLDLQAKEAAHREEVAALKAQIAEYDEFNALASHYSLTEYHPATLVYTLSKSAADVGPPHHACPNCFGKKVRVILQATGESVYRDRQFICGGCKSVFVIGTPKSR